MERRVTPAKRVTSLTWGHPPPCKQALNKANVKIISYLALQVFFLQMLPWSLGCWSAPFCPESLRLLPALDHHQLYDESANCSGNRRNILPDQGDWKREEVHVLPLKRSFALTHYMWMRKKPFCNEELPLWRDQSSISRIRSVVAVWLIISRAFSPETWSNTRSIVTRHGCFLAQIMPSSNLLSFLRPLYDIAVWQFILILGFKVERRRIGRLKFIWKMHQVVANFVCKLLEARPFDHWKQEWKKQKLRWQQRDGNQGIDWQREWSSCARINGGEKIQHTLKKTAPSPSTSLALCPGLTTCQSVSIAVFLAQSAVQNLKKTFHQNCPLPLPFCTLGQYVKNRARRMDRLNQGKWHHEWPWDRLAKNKFSATGATLESSASGLCT